MCSGILQTFKYKRNTRILSSGDKVCLALNVYQILKKQIIFAK